MRSCARSSRWPGTSSSTSPATIACSTPRPACCRAGPSRPDLKRRRARVCEPLSCQTRMCVWSGGGGERLDLGREAALVASGLVLVEDALVGDRIDDALRRLEEVGRLVLVAGGDGLLHVLDDGAELRTQRRVGGVQPDVLAGALAARRDANRLFLGFGGGGHGLELSGLGGLSKDSEYSI